MKKFLVNLCFRKYRKEIEDRFLTEMYGMIPSDIKKPSIDFLIGGKDKLEKFFSIQAYEMQRRSIMDHKNAPAYQGILIHIKSLLLLIQSGKPSEFSPIEENKKKVEDPVKGVDEFIKMGKEKLVIQK